MIQSFFEHNLVFIGLWTITGLGLLFAYGLLSWVVISLARALPWEKKWATDVGRRDPCPGRAREEYPEQRRAVGLEWSDHE